MRTWPVYILVLLASCSLHKGYNKKIFGFAGGDREQKMVLQVPQGYVMEKTLLDTTGGKEMYYYYENGCILYYSRNVSWLTENAPLIPQTTASQELFSAKGTDKDGLHWKEMRIDDLRFGYSYVPSGQLELFEFALRNFHLRKSTILNGHSKNQ